MNGLLFSKVVKIANRNLRFIGFFKNSSSNFSLGNIYISNRACMFCGVLNMWQGKNRETQLFFALLS